MGFSFRKRLKIMKGLYLNFSKNGVSTSVGGPGATLNFGKNGTRVTTSIPGTGIRYSKNLSNNKKDIVSDFQDESNSVLTIDNYNFTGKVPKDANNTLGHSLRILYKGYNPTLSTSSKVEFSVRLSIR